MPGRVSFYWCLPEYLPLPDGWKTVLRLDPDGVPRFESGTEIQPGIELLPDFIGSVTYHQVQRSTDAGLEVAFEVANRAPWSHIHSGNSPDWATSLEKPGLGDDTDIDMGDSEPTSLTHRTVVRMVVAVTAEPSETEVAEAFETCLDLICSTHIALHAVTGHGWLRPTAEAEQLGILIALDRVEGTSLTACWPLGLYFLSGPTRHAVQKLTAFERDALKRAELQAVQRTPRSLIFDLQAHAVGAARRSGDTRLAIIMAATACEAWIDLILASLLWEEGLSPEAALSEFKRYRDSMERLLRLVANRIGGSWDHKSVRALRDWRFDVAEARNLVAHMGSLPSRHSAERAIDGMYGFFSLTLDRLCAPAPLAKYPLSALLLAERVGLERRSGWTRRLRDAATEADDLDLAGAFARWKTALTDLMLPEERRKPPSPNESTRMFVRLADGRSYWLNHDAGARAAQLAAPTNETRATELEATTAAHCPKGQSMTFSFDEAPRLRPVGDWLPEHRLVPNIALLRDPRSWAIPPGAPPSSATPTAR